MAYRPRERPQWPPLSDDAMDIDDPKHAEPKRAHPSPEEEPESPGSKRARLDKGKAPVYTRPDPPSQRTTNMLSLASIVHGFTHTLPPPRAATPPAAPALMEVPLSGVLPSQKLPAASQPSEFRTLQQPSSGSPSFGIAPAPGSPGERPPVVAAPAANEPIPPVGSISVQQQQSGQASPAEGPSVSLSLSGGRPAGKPPVPATALVKCPRTVSHIGVPPGPSASPATAGKKHKDILPHDKATSPAVHPLLPNRRCNFLEPQTTIVVGEVGPLYKDISCVADLAPLKLRLPASVTVGPDSLQGDNGQVFFRPAGSTTEIYTTSHIQLVGIINANTLNPLFSIPAIQLRGLVCFPSPIPEQPPYGLPKIPVQVRVVVMTSIGSIVQVSETLRRLGLFLEHFQSPMANETAYINPHYMALSVPQMTFDYGALNNSICSCTVLNEADKARVMRALKAAEGSKEAPLTPSKRLKSELLFHQKAALSMMAEREHGLQIGACYNSPWEVGEQMDGLKVFRDTVTGVLHCSEPTTYFGGILADGKRSGKTLTALALIAYHLDNRKANTEPEKRPTLVVVQKTEIATWIQEINKHFKIDTFKVLVAHGLKSISEYNVSGFDIVITTYGSLPWGIAPDTEWFRIIYDDAHVIRDPESPEFKAAQSLMAVNRWCLTATPITSCLGDYASLLSLLNIHQFSSKQMFDHCITTPFLSRMSYGEERLRRLFSATCMRRPIIETQYKEPSSSENVEVQLDHKDRHFYDFTRSYMAIFIKGDKFTNEGINTDNMLDILRFLCDHAESVVPRYISLFSTGHAVAPSGILWDGHRRCTACEGLEEPGNYILEFSCLHVLCNSCSTQAEYKGLLQGPKKKESFCPTCQRVLPSQAASGVYSAKVKSIIEHIVDESAFNLFKRGKPLKHKHVVVSQWPAMLSQLELALRDVNKTFRRIEEESDIFTRIEALGAYNGNKADVMLITYGAIKHGLDLSAGHIIHIAEAQRDPNDEKEAFNTIHRFGQTQECKVFYYTTIKTIEEHIGPNPRRINWDPEEARKEEYRSDIPWKDDLLKILRDC